jgi:hypothetical protein
MTDMNASRAVRLAGVLLVVAAALDRLLGGDNLTLLHGVLMSLGLALLAASMAMHAGKRA